MKRFFLSVMILCMVLLTACTANDPATTPTTSPPSTQTSTETTFSPTEAPANPEHSWLFIPGLDVEDVILYFNEVCLDAEFVESGDASKVQKWMEPIYYTLYGPYTDEDLEALASFTEFLNSIDGFPGISEIENSWQTNLEIHFCTSAELMDLMGDQYWGTDGAVTFWYTNNEIHTAIICYSTETTQYVRNSVILEEIYNGLGPVQDTSLRTDSIIYAGYSEPQELTEIDKLLLTLLYHPKIECGMDADACEAVIRELYY